MPSINMRLAKFVNAWDNFNRAASALSDAWFDLTDQERDILHIDGAHVPTGEFTGEPSRCSKCDEFARSYGDVFNHSFDDWAYELALLTGDVRDRVLESESGNE